MIGGQNEHNKAHHLYRYLNGISFSFPIQLCELN